MSPDGIERLVNSQLMTSWTGVSYSFLDRNCCSFARELCWHLVRAPMPGWVDRFARLASVCVPRFEMAATLSTVSQPIHSITPGWSLVATRGAGARQLPTFKTTAANPVPRSTSLMSSGCGTQFIGASDSFVAEQSRLRSDSDTQGGCNTPLSTGLSHFGRMPEWPKPSAGFSPLMSVPALITL